MEEIKPQQPNKNNEEGKSESKPLLEKVKELEKFKEEVNSGKRKPKKMRIPRKAKVKGRKQKKGYIGILKISENGTITGEKQRISGFSFMDDDGLYHATDRREVLYWDGKFPVLVQPSWRNNPVLISKNEEKNETYGQPYIKAKMLADTIKVKAKGKSIIIWIILAGAALFGINYFMGGNLFG